MEPVRGSPWVEGGTGPNPPIWGCGPRGALIASNWMSTHAGNPYASPLRGGYDPRRADGVAGSSVRLSWVALICALVIVVMFIPIRRYALPGNLPFELEPYRLLVVVVVTGWFAALLVDPRVTLKPTGLRGPLILLLVAVLGSLAVNPGNVSAEQTQVVKSLTFLLSFLLVLMMIVSVVNTRAAVDRILKVLVGSGAIVAVFAIIESRTDFNVFNELGRVIPFLRLEEVPLIPGRGARLRVFASAQHSIALSAAMVMLVPLAFYLAVRTRRRLWWVAGGLMVVAAVATISRTGILMLAVILIVFAVLRPADARRALPDRAPAAADDAPGHPRAPSARCTPPSPPRAASSPSRSRTPGRLGSGRVADLGPALDQAAARPLLGQGYGTRVTDNQQAKANILDNQWLGTLLETGILGVFAWVWLFGRTVRRLGARARRDASDLGLLMTGLAASITAFAVGLFTYDAYSFIQVTYIMFILVALSVVLLRVTGDGERPSHGERHEPQGESTGVGDHEPHHRALAAAAVRALRRAGRACGPTSGSSTWARASAPPSSASTASTRSRRWTSPPRRARGSSSRT